MWRYGITVLGALLVLLAGPQAVWATGLTGSVDVFAGTRPGPHTFGGGHNFPGATVPFGMVQWSPDTTPSDRHLGGYDYRDHHLKGFSLTHLSGAGCKLYGDFPFLPTTEPLASTPLASGSPSGGDLEPGFSHTEERGRPGYYRVRLNPAHGGGIDTALTATTRTGLARFTFPADPHSSVLVDAGGSAQPDDFSSVQIDPRAHEIDGSASSGLFCGQRPRYRVFFAAVFNRPFSAYGTWTSGGLRPGTTTAAASQAPPSNPPESADSGAYASFDTRRNRTVLVRVGISFVSVEGARANLAAEDPGFAFGKIAARAQRAWDASLGRIRIDGGPRRQVDTFYTMLYHAFLAPRTFSDVGGAYPGMDGTIQRAHGRIQYADFSGWDVYRSEIQLLSLLVPRRASDMVSSLLADAAQSGCLPRWPYANGQSMTMVGDSADPIIASASAFGARGFDKRAALAAMLAGAVGPCWSANGEYLERQGLDRYLALGYVPYGLDTNVRNANSIYGAPEDVWASAATTLEYAVDDFSIAQFAARGLQDRGAYGAFMWRSGNWRNLLNPRSAQIEPRMGNGAFLPHYDSLHGGGFVEGDSVQYTWMVPQNPAGLFAALGGRARAAGRLDRFLRQLNGGAGATHTDHALLGNEPNLNVPWLYDWARRPYSTQQVVRRALLTLYDTSPDGYPGNDDLGTLSAWYVFGALGFYPEVPGVGLLAIGSPLFGRTVISLPHRRHAVIVATAYRLLRSKSGHGGGARRVALSPSRAPFVQGLSLNGHAYGRPWTTYCALARGARLTFRLGARPNRAWGSSAAAAPASYGPRRAMPKDSCTP